MLTYQLDPYESHGLINLHLTEIASFVADLAGPITTISMWLEMILLPFITKIWFNNHEFGYILMISHVVHNVCAVNFQEVTEMRFHDVLIRVGPVSASHVQIQKAPAVLPELWLKKRSARQWVRRSFNPVGSRYKSLL